MLLKKKKNEKTVRLPAAPQRRGRALLLEQAGPAYPEHLAERGWGSPEKLPGAGRLAGELQVLPARALGSITEIRKSERPLA